MNKAGREATQKAIAMLHDARALLSDLADEEQEKYDNLSEGLQSSERGQAFESNAEALKNAADEIDSVIDNLNELE